MADLNEPYHDAEQKKEGKLLSWRRVSSVHISGLWFNLEKVWRIIIIKKKNAKKKKKKNSHEGKKEQSSLPYLFDTHDNKRVYLRVNLAGRGFPTIKDLLFPPSIKSV